MLRLALAMVVLAVPAVILLAVPAVILLAVPAAAAPYPDMVDLPGRPLAMARTETTVGQWRACVEDGGCSAKPSLRWSEPDHPMTDVTLADAEAFATWLSRATGRHHRLPTIEEWEIAARAGTKTAFAWGETMQPGRAVCYGCDPRFDHRPAPVATMAANPWGLFDMHGNVWEWTQTCADPECRTRWVAGGSWYFVPHQSRSDGRSAQDARLWSYDIGFRVVRD
ncbi:formylglycine-generating enzyme family protein [Magnetospirillum moscoviense]|nr:SUMF1/EgtB/PvdO family nonheme iron enzyme [Magnetospirillum moscoviense]